MEILKKRFQLSNKFSMLTIRSIELQNFLSHTKTFLTFSENQRLLIDGKSGHGKSAIVDAVIWCLYGIGRVDHRSLIHSGASSAKVTEILSDGKIFYRIIRQITHAGKHTLSIETSGDGATWQLAPVNGIKATQEYIDNNLLHASHSLFINSVVFPQESHDSFVRQTAAKRKDLLLEIAQASNFDAFYSRAQKFIEARDENIAKINGDIASKDKVIELAKDAKITLDTYSLMLEKAIIEKEQAEQEINNIIKVKAELESFSVKYNGAKASLKEAQDRLNITEEEIKRLNARILSIKSLSTDGSEECFKRIRELKDLIIPLEENEKLVFKHNSDRNALLSNAPPNPRNFDANIAQFQRQLDELGKAPEAKCQKCGEPIPFFVDQVQRQKTLLESQLLHEVNGKTEYEKAIQEHAEKIKQLGEAPVSRHEELKKAKEELAELENRSKNFEAAKAALATIDELNATISVQNAILEKNQKDLTLCQSNLLITQEAFESASKNILGTIASESELIEKKKTSEDIIQSLSATIAEKKVLIKMAEEAEKEISTLKTEQQKMDKELQSLRAVKEAFGSKGIKTIIIDFFVPKLEKSINDILSQLSDFRVEIDTQRESLDGESTVEGLFINVIDADGVVKEFDSYSGGEKLKIVVAISEALARLQNVGFRIMDEMFIGLDAESTEGFVAVLEKVQSRFSQLIVISHLQNIKDIFNETIEVIKRDGVSTINKS